MKVIPISNKVSLIRHWGRWYKVQRGVDDWRKLNVAPYKRPFNVDKAIDGLAKVKYNKPIKKGT